MKTTKRLLTIFLVALLVLVTLTSCNKNQIKTTHILKDNMVSIYTTGECYVKVTIKVKTGENFEKDIKVMPDAVTVIGINNIIPASYSMYLEESGNDIIEDVSIKEVQYPDWQFVVICFIAGALGVLVILKFICVQMNKKDEAKQKNENKTDTGNKKVTKKK